MTNTEAALFEKFKAKLDEAHKQIETGNFLNVADLLEEAAGIAEEAGTEGSLRAAQGAREEAEKFRFFGTLFGGVLPQAA